MQRNKISYKGQRIFIGIDVHKESWVVAVAPEVGVVKTHTQKASAKELIDFLHKHYPDGDYRAVYESGFSGFSTYYALEDVGISCLVIHAADVPTTQYDEAMKSDKVDAAKLVKSLKAGLLKGIYIHGKEDLDARSVFRVRCAINSDLGAYKSRVKHLLHSNGVVIPERFSHPGTHWSSSFISWLRNDVRLLSSTRASLDLLLEQVESTRSSLLRATRKLRELGRSERYSELYGLLMSVPGVGPIVAIALLTEIGDFRRFRNERQFASYLGLVPTSHSSGEKVSHGEKTFRGNKRLGLLLVESAWVMAYRNHDIGADYHRYLQRMPPQKAIIKVARRMANTIFSVVRRRRPYECFNR